MSEKGSAADPWVTPVDQDLPPGTAHSTALPASA